MSVNFHQVGDAISRWGKPPPLRRSFHRSVRASTTELSFVQAGKAFAKQWKLQWSGGGFPHSEMASLTWSKLPPLTHSLPHSDKALLCSGSFGGAEEAFPTRRCFPHLVEVMAERGKLWLSKGSFGRAGEAISEWGKPPPLRRSFPCSVKACPAE